MTIRPHTHPTDPPQDSAMHLREYHGLDTDAEGRKGTDLEQKHSDDHLYFGYYFDERVSEQHPTKGQ